MLAISDSYQALSDVQVQEFERTIGGRLPHEFRSFLLKHNGGKPNPKRFSTRDGKVESLVSKFFPLFAETEDSVVGEFEGFNLAGQLASNLLSIAQDPTENRIVIAFRGDDVGAVYYWSWDEEPTPASRSYSYLRLIADGFDDFLEALR